MDAFQRSEVRYSKDFLILLLAHIIRCDQLIRIAVERLAPTDFSGADERIFGVVWRVARDFYRDNNCLIPERVLRAKVEQAVINDVQPADAAAALVLVEDLFCFEDNLLFPAAAVKDLQSFMRERRFIQPAKVLLEQDGPDMMTELSKLYAGSTVGGAVRKRVAPFMLPGFGQRAHKLETKVSYWDEGFDGGIPIGAVTGLLGGTGSGKTTMLLHIGSQYPMAVPDGRSLFLSYEQSLEGDIYDRLYACAMGVSRKRLAGLKFEQLTAHEQKLYAGLRSAVGERLIACDMREDSGNTGAQEIKLAIDEYAQDFGAVPNLVLVDWLLPVVMKVIMASPQYGLGDLRMVIQQFTQEMVQVAEEFKTSIVIAHQLSTEACNKPPSYKPRWQDAAEAKNFSWLLESVGAIGNPEENGQKRWFNISKNRQGRLLAIAIELKGEFSRFDACGPDWTCKGKTFYQTTEPEDTSVQPVV